MAQVSDERPVLLQSNFLNRVCNIPTVASALQVGTAQYQRLRNANGLVGGALGYAERGAAYAAETVPHAAVVRAFARPIEYIDEVACRGLDKVEERLPQLKNPPEQIFSDVKDYSTSRIYDVTAAVLPAQKMNECWGQLYNYLETALQATDSILDYHIASIGEQNVSRSIDKTEFRARLTDISLKIRICITHHTGTGIASVKDISTNPRAHLLATLTYVGEIRDDLLNGKTLKEVLDKLQVNWLVNLISGDSTHESAARQVLTLFNNAVARATTKIQSTLPVESFSKFVPTPDSLAALTSSVLEQFRLYAARFQSLAQQLPSALDWMPKVFLDVRNKSIEASLNRNGLTQDSDDASSNSSEAF